MRDDGDDGAGDHNQQIVRVKTCQIDAGAGYGDGKLQRFFFFAGAFFGAFFGFGFLSFFAAFAIEASSGPE